MSIYHLSQSRTSKSDGLHNDERGLSTVEYVIILVLIAVTGIAVWKTFGTTIYNKIDGANRAVADDVVPHT